MRKTLFCLFMLATLAGFSQSRQTLLSAALRNSNSGDSAFLLRDSVLAHIYYDAESDSMLLSGLRMENYLTPADIDYMRLQLKNYKPHTWTGDSIPHAVVVSSSQLPSAAMSVKKSTKAWTNYFKTHTHGYYEVSTPVFSKDGKTAIVYVSFMCGQNCGNGGATLYRFENGEWKPVKNLFAWEKHGK